MSAQGVGRCGNKLCGMDEGEKGVGKGSAKPWALQQVCCLLTGQVLQWSGRVRRKGHISTFLKLLAKLGVKSQRSRENSP